MSILSDAETKKAHRKALEEIDRLKQAVSTGMAREIVVMQRRLTEEALDAWEEERRDPWAEKRGSMSETELRREVRVGHQGEGRRSRLRFEWFLHGPLGTVQFVVWARPEGDGPGFYRQWAMTGVDVGYHAREPQYEDQVSMDTECDVIGGKCYYDGSGLRADELLRRFEREGDKAIWETLEDRYRGWLEGGYEREEAAALKEESK